MKQSALFRKYKNYLLIVFFIFSSIFIILKIILPQISEILTVTSEVDKESELVASLERTLSVLNSISTAKIDKNFELASTALPQEKDLVLIFSELAATSQKAGVELGGFVINVGEVYSKEKKKNGLPSEKGSPSLNFTVRADGKPDNLKEFAALLHKTIPLIEIESISFSENSGLLSANFYYNPIVFESSEKGVAAKPINENEEAILNQLEEWKKNSIPLEIDNSDNEPPSNNLEKETSPTPSKSPTLSTAPTR